MTTLESTIRTIFSSNCSATLPKPHSTPQNSPASVHSSLLKLFCLSVGRSFSLKATQLATRSVRAFNYGIYAHHVRCFQSRLRLYYLCLHAYRVATSIIAPPLTPHLFLLRITIITNNYRDIPPKFGQALTIEALHRK